MGKGEVRMEYVCVCGVVRARTGGCNKETDFSIMPPCPFHAAWLPVCLPLYFISKGLPEGQTMAA